MAELCVLCGIPAPDKHPWVGVGRANLEKNEGDMMAHPVCHPCFINPEHRLRKNIKMHYHARANYSAAVQGARRMDDLSKSGKDMNL